MTGEVDRGQGEGSERPAAAGRGGGRPGGFPPQARHVGTRAGGGRSERDAAARPAEGRESTVRPSEAPGRNGDRSAAGSGRSRGAGAGRSASASRGWTDLDPWASAPAPVGPGISAPDTPGEHAPPGWADGHEPPVADGGADRGVRAGEDGGHAARAWPSAGCSSGKDRASDAGHPRVFVAHGGAGRSWHELADFLRAAVAQVEVVDGGQGTNDRPALSKLLTCADVAVLVHTADDETVVDTRRARQAVVRECMRCSRSLGPDRTVLLYEDGSGPFPMIAGVRAIRYPRGLVSSAFGEVLRALAGLP